MSSPPLRFALPKGRILDETAAIFARAGSGVFAQNAPTCTAEGMPDGHAPLGSAPGATSVSGALDLAGGVGEFTADLFNTPTELCWAAAGPFLNPRCDVPSPSQGTGFTVRGGAWTFAGGNLRVAFRHFASSLGIDQSVGFRCARNGQ